MKPHVLVPIAVSLAFAGGCKATPVLMPDRSAVEIATLQASTLFAAQPGVTSSLPRDGMARLQASLRVKQVPKLGFSVLAAAPELTLSTFTKAAMTLYSGTAFTAYNAKTHTSEVEFGNFNDNSDASKTAIFKFPPLMPADDYEASLFLKNKVRLADKSFTERLAGSHKQSPIKLRTGDNKLDFEVTVNGEELSYALTSSETGNQIDDSNITKDDVVTLATGIQAEQPGVAAVKIYLLGACYGTGKTPVLVANLTDPTTWNTYRWETAVATEGFVPTDFHGGEDFDALSGQLIVQAVNARAEVVGTARFEIGVLGRPKVNVTVR